MLVRRVGSVTPKSTRYVDEAFVHSHIGRPRGRCGCGPRAGPFLRHTLKSDSTTLLTNDTKLFVLMAGLTALGVAIGHSLGGGKGAGVALLRRPR